MEYQLLQYKAELKADDLIEIILRIIMMGKNIHLTENEYKLAIYVMKYGASLEDLKSAVDNKIFLSLASVRNSLTKLHKSNILVRDKARKLRDGRFIFNHELVKEINTPGILVSLKLKADDYKIQG
jgi:predicted transcriptional regulator